MAPQLAQQPALGQPPVVQQSGARALAPDVTVRQAAQLQMDQREEFIERGSAPLAPGQQ
jgi:hypothetical protein